MRIHLILKNYAYSGLNWACLNHGSVTKGLKDCEQDTRTLKGVCVCEPLSADKVKLATAAFPRPIVGLSLHGTNAKLTTPLLTDS